MAVILTMEYVVATAPLIERMLDCIVAKVHDPRIAITVATLVGGVGSYLNWGFGLVIGGVVARKLAMSAKCVHYPLIIASAYSGFTLYGLGLSASIPVLISTKGHPPGSQDGRDLPLRDYFFAHHAAHSAGGADNAATAERMAASETRATGHRNRSHPGAHGAR